MDKFKILLAGNPNVGKSTVFNALTGENQHTGNWIGKTVASAKGEFNYLDKSFEIYDLPGTYSLNAYSKEEEVTRDAIYNLDYDLIVVVVDSSMLNRNLNLVLQILEIYDNVILCCNLIDEATKNGIKIDSDKLSEKLGIDVVLTSARNNMGMDKLLDSIYNNCLNKNSSSYKVRYSDYIEDAIKLLENKIDSDIYNKRFLSIKLLTDDKDFLNNYKDLFNNLDSHLVKLIYSDIGYGPNKIRENIVVDINKNQDLLVEDCVFNSKLNRRNRIDKILTSKLTGIPIMILMLMTVFFITIVLSNYPSDLLFNLFGYIGEGLRNIFDFLRIPGVIKSCLIDGIYVTLTWVVSVMLPPMAIFFPLFSLLEDLGYLPRVAFNMDGVFQKCGSCGKQSLTMMMGFGCNAVGVTGSKIIENEKQRKLAMLTNAFVPCNGRFPMIISIIAMFLVGTSNLSIFYKVLLLTLFIILSCIITFITTFILSRTIFKSNNSSFSLELPPIRKPEIIKTIIRSFKDKTLAVLLRAIKVSIPAGIIIWIFANTSINNLSILNYIVNFLDPFAKIMGLDGVVLSAFLLAFPANELVIPIIIMSYLSNGYMVDMSNLSELKNLLLNNGWTVLTALNTIIFSMFHFPCSTTLLTIKNESKDNLFTFLSFVIPLLVGVILCIIINLVYTFIF